MARHSKKTNEPKESTKEKLSSIKKAKKQKLKEKRGRLVIRNLPFETTEENLKEYFEKYGEISDIKVLKKEDGKLVGCAFVQFTLVQKAKKARHHTNGKPFLGREITVDFALAKDKYEGVKVKDENDVEVKDEPRDDEAEVKTEEDEEMNNEDVEKKKKKKKKTEEESDVENGDAENGMDEAENGEEEEKDADDVDEEMQEQVDDPEEKKKNNPSFADDASEGKTVFVKNIPFSVTKEEFKECMSQFGPLSYAIICMDRFTEHSRGTGFAKYQNKEDTVKALAAGTALTLAGNNLHCQLAMTKEQMNQRKQAQQQIKDNARNLYLAKEGAILVGSPASKGVSATDMMKRLQLEEFKIQKLGNFDSIISPFRLVVHNLPPTYDNNMLRQLFTTFAPEGAFIKEAKVMRDFRYEDASGMARSKEFGYVSFARHQDALAALRAVNNNPEIFSFHKRPIVAFAIDSRSALNLKRKRLQNSKMRNPNFKRYNRYEYNGEKRYNRYENNVEKRYNRYENNDEGKEEQMGGYVEEEKGEEKDERPNFVGVTAKRGAPIKMRSRYTLKNQADLHMRNLKRDKHTFVKKNFYEKQKNFVRQPSQKIFDKEESDEFSKIEMKHKKMLNTTKFQGSKWDE